MLVLSRKKGERIVIGDAVEVTVLEVRGNRVRLGFRCPGDIRIHREEVIDRLPTGPTGSTFDPLLKPTPVSAGLAKTCQEIGGT